MNELINIRVTTTQREKMDRLAGKLGLKNRQAVLRHLIEDYSENGAGPKPEIERPIGSKCSRLYTLLLSKGVLKVTPQDLRSLGYAVDIRTQASQRTTMDVLEAQGFLRWDGEERAWRVKKKLLK